MVYQFDPHYLQIYTSKKTTLEEDQKTIKKFQKTLTTNLPPPLFFLPTKKQEISLTRWQKFAFKKGIRKTRNREIYDTKNDTFVPRFGRFARKKDPRVDIIDSFYGVKGKCKKGREKRTCVDRAFVSE